MTNIFLSYCRKDAAYAEAIEQHYGNTDVKIYRDIRDIAPWDSIRKFMDTIRDTDFAVLIITDNYLKSPNCMYEVLQVMKKKDYNNKIFPVVVEPKIYETNAKIDYIKYWEAQYRKLSQELSEVAIVNTGSLIDDLRRTQEIALSIGDFLKTVSDMNNPAAQDVTTAIDAILCRNSKMTDHKSAENYFKNLNITMPQMAKHFTDHEKNVFVKTSYATVIKNIKGLSEQLHSQNDSYTIDVDDTDLNETLIQAFKDGYTIFGLRIFLTHPYGGSSFNIGISQDMNIGDKNSYNEIYIPEIVDGNLLFKGQMTHIIGNGNKNPMTSQELTKEIWEYFIQPHL